MKRSERVASMLAVGIFGVAAIAFATEIVGDYVSGDLEIRGGDLNVGMSGSVAGGIDIMGAATYPNWTLDRNGGDLRIRTTSGTYRVVHIYNTTSGKGVDVDMHAGDLILQHGDGNILDGDLNVAAGDVALDNGGILFTEASTPASITSNADGDVIIQLGN